MRRLLIGIALFVALLGAIGLGFIQPTLAVHSVVAHTHLLVDGSPTPNGPVCPGGGSGVCD